MRYFLHLAYNGAPFHGWQIQPNDVSVQSVIENALERLTGVPVAVTGAGRTDAGVNARHMVAHLDLPDAIVPDERWFRSLRAMVGRDIALLEIHPVAADAHARFDAISRTYRYFVHTSPNPFTGGFSWQAPPRFDFEKMNEAAELILGTRDFTSFSKLHTDVKTNICTVTSAGWYRDSAPLAPVTGSQWFFEITADRFLRNMVRAVVGTLADVGRGKIRPESVLEILDAKDRCAAGTSMPASPLFLWDVAYLPEKIMPLSNA